jgi:cytochrome c oxidase cbb3-type subunit 4
MAGGVRATGGHALLLPFFLAVLAYAFWPKNRARFDAAARSPLRED